MHEFIEKNRRLLKIYCVVARIIGWILLIVPLVGIVWVLLESTDNLRGQNRIWLLMWPENVVNIWMLGFIALGIAAFIRYLFETESRPGWTLRHSEWILYIGAVLVVIVAILRCISLVYTMRKFAGNGNIYSIILGLLMSTVLCTAKVLILVGLGKILRRLMPVIEESKSLV
jgi:uncharacterized membrane protein